MQIRTPSGWAILTSGLETSHLKVYSVRRTLKQKPLNPLSLLILGSFVWAQKRAVPSKKKRKKKRP